jgi:hypothetical protein
MVLTMSLLLIDCGFGMMILSKPELIWIYIKIDFMCANMDNKIMGKYNSQKPFFIL